MMQVADHLHGPSGVEDVIRTLPNSISDGMFTMMENMEAVKNKVRVRFVTGYSWQADKTPPPRHSPSLIWWRQPIL